MVLFAGERRKAGVVNKYFRCVNFQGDADDVSVGMAKSGGERAARLALRAI